jgi:hypothetical protein
MELRGDQQAGRENTNYDCTRTVEVKILFLIKWHPLNFQRIFLYILYGIEHQTYISTV